MITFVLHRTEERMFSTKWNYFAINEFLDVVMLTIVPQHATVLLLICRCLADVELILTLDESCQDTRWFRKFFHR